MARLATVRQSFTMIRKDRKSRRIVMIVMIVATKMIVKTTRTQKNVTCLSL